MHYISLSSIRSAYQLSKSSSPQKWPSPSVLQYGLQYFHSLVKEDSGGMDATVHAIFRQFLPTVDLSYIEEFLLLGYLDPCVFTSCLRSRSQPKNCGVRTVSISTGEMALCQFLLLLLLFLVVLPLFRTFDTSTRRNERKTKKVCCGIVNFSCHIRLIGFVCVFVDC